MKSKLLLTNVLLILLLAGCTKSDTVQKSSASKDTKIIGNQITSMKAQNGGKVYHAEKYMAEYITDAKSGKVGQTIYFKNTGNKQLGIRYVPGDPRRGGRYNVTYTIDDETTTDNGLTSGDVKAAIDRAMATWNGVQCSDLNITKVPFTGNLGFISATLGFGGSFNIVADVQHSGFLPGAFFETIAKGGSDFIIAITYPFIWVDENNVPTDINHDGYVDFAFAEIYYNDKFTWRTNSGTGVDLQTIALHESGHALGQAHFGKAFTTVANGKLHFAPKAVMNAGYFGGEQRSLLGTDLGGHCSIWASWLNK